MTREPDYRWAAGIVDAEGSIGVYSFKSKGTPRKQFMLRLSVVNCDPKMLLRMQEMFGGNIKPRQNKRRSKWEWALYSRSAVPAIEAVLPHLICKHDQALLALEFAATIQGHGSPRSNEIVGRREEIRDELKVLHHTDHSLEEVS